MPYINDDRSAFPGQAYGSDGLPMSEYECGMSLRDFFAAKALPALIAATAAGQHMPMMKEADQHIRFSIARDAYDMADAMLAAREGGAS